MNATLPLVFNRIPAADAAEILDVIARYAQVIDNRDWDELGSVFTAGMTFGNGTPPTGYSQLPAVIEGVSPYHPHYSTNTVLHQVHDNEVKAWSKYLVIRTDGSAGSGDYIDTFVRRSDGWRIDRREVSRGRRPPADPGGASERTFTTMRWVGNVSQ